ncbi:MAG: hypothetical protein ACRCSP_00550 [Rhodoglobus sp.]
MSRTFTLTDRWALGDLQVFLERAMRVEEGSVRLIAGSGVLAVYVSVLHPSGLMDESPTVLGLRTFAIADDDNFDAVVPVRSLLLRVEGQQGLLKDDDPVIVTLPMEVNTMTWAAISPPRGGWHELPSSDPAIFEAAAHAGIAEIAEAIPAGAGEQLVQRVRTEIWARTIRELDFVPAGAAFAALSLGFLSEGKPVSIHESGPWTRLTTQGGHVLVKRRAWSMAR